MWVFTTPLKIQLTYTGVSFMNSSVFSFSERLKIKCHSQYRGLAWMEESADWSSKFNRLGRTNNQGFQTHEEDCTTLVLQKARAFRCGSRDHVKIAVPS